MLRCVPLSLWTHCCRWSRSSLFERTVLIDFALVSQLADIKKKVEQEAQTLESMEDGKKKLQREVESIMQQLEERNAGHDKLEKTKTRLQRELDDVLLDQAHLRQTVQELERKQKKFDQVENC